MKTVPELVETTKKMELARHDEWTGQVNPLRPVNIEHLEQLTTQVTYTTEEGKEFQFLIDEPHSRGGLDRAGTALVYFLAGAGG